MREPMSPMARVTPLSDSAEGNSGASQIMLTSRSP
jgi:hypothetical protein